MTRVSRPFFARTLAARGAGTLVVAAFVALGGGCAMPASAPWLAERSQQAEAEGEARSRRVDRSRTERLEREIEQLREDLHQAEAAMLATDSELRAGRNRASAVSMLAEARISLEQAERSVSWKRAVVEEGQQKLAEGERQLRAGRPPAAAYFASRAQHIADSLIAEARLVKRSPDTRFVKSERLNVRAGPSTEDAILLVLTRGTPLFSQRAKEDWLEVRTLNGQVGWVYASLLAER